MADLLKLPPGWRVLSIEDRGLLLTLAFGTKATVWQLNGVELSTSLGVSIERTQRFIDAAIAAEVLTASNGAVMLVEPSDDLKKSWEQRFHEVFWPAVSSPWKKVGRANALKVWMTSTYALIMPKTEAAADELLEQIMKGVERYKQLLLQPNAPQMKYPEGWLSGQRWQDEIDVRFIELHGHPAQAAMLSSPLDRARRVQSEQRLLIEPTPPAIPVIPVQRPEVSNEDALPEFSFSL